jgi:hypothetical protein
MPRVWYIPSKVWAIQSGVKRSETQPKNVFGKVEFYNIRGAADAG